MPHPISTKRPLLCVDAPALLYRAFYAMPDSILGGDGRPVNALLGAVNMLIQVVNDYRPRAVVICFGEEAAEYRVESFAQYHSSRPEMPNDLDHQWAMAPDLFASFGWIVAATSEFEADDLLHSYAVKEAINDGYALILTGDRDMFASVNERIYVLLQERGKRGPTFVDREEVHSRYGIYPEQVADFIALRGDPSDEIPGAKGIGPKTAAELLTNYCDLEGVLANAITQKPSVRHSLIEQADQLRMFKQIATLQILPVEHPGDKENMWRQGAEAARKIGMNALAERVEQLSPQI